MRNYVALLSVVLSACSQMPANSTAANEAIAPANGAATPATTTPDSPVRSGPFGFDMGQSLEGLKLTKSDKAGFYTSTSVPKPHPDFESVVLEAYPSTGVCMIRGIGRDLVSDGSGDRARAKADELAGVLSTKYGDGKSVNTCSAGDIACNSQFWMMTMKDGQRFYGYLWEKPSEAMSKAKIGSIAVASGATDINTSYVVVEYSSTNEGACEKARKASSASSL